MRGPGRIFERKGSPYFSVAYYAHGQEQREVARHVRTGKKIAVDSKNARYEAERFLKHKLGEIAAEKHGGRPFVGPQQERITVNELLDGLESDYKLRDKWNYKVASNMKPVCEQFGTRRAVDITPNAIAAYIEESRERYSNGTVNRRMALLRQAFKLAIRNKQVSAAPFIPRLSEIGCERQGFFETADFEAIVANLPEYLRDFCRFAFLTGWRKGSIASLRWADVQGDVIYLRSENSKSRKPESVPIEGELQDIIERRRTARSIEAENGAIRFAEHVFHHNGKQIGSFRKAWATACKKANVGHHLFHDLRRTASRNMIAAGVPQAVAMKITGHKTDSMFRRYAIVDEAQKREALAKTQQYLGNSGERKVVSMGGKK